MPPDAFDADSGAEGNMRRIVWTGEMQKATFHPRVKGSAEVAEHDCHADVLCGTQVRHQVESARGSLAEAGFACATDRAF